MPNFALEIEKEKSLKLKLRNDELIEALKLIRDTLLEINKGNKHSELIKKVDSVINK